jgi:hypothetical protein
MLTALDTSPVSAYPLPWHVERMSDTHAIVFNRSPEPLDSVRAFHSDGATFRWGRLLPGDSIDLCLCDSDLDDLVLTLCWFRESSSSEYIWRFVM